jgi:hypothetical protein
MQGRRVRKGIFALLFLLLSVAGFGQISGTTLGIAPFGSYTSDPLGDVNAANLNTHLVIPLRSKGAFVANLQYDSNVIFSAYPGVPAPNLGALVLNTSILTTFGITEGPYCSDRSDSAASYAIIDAGGFTHTWPNVIVDNKACIYPLTSYGFDPYGWKLNASCIQNQSCSGTVTDPNGSVYLVYGNVVTDHNGNQITSTTPGSTWSYTDWTGKTVLSVDQSNQAQYVYSYADQSGNTQQIKANRSQHTLQTNFGCSGLTELGPRAWYLTDSINLPDGSSYSFTYEPTPGHSANTTGRIQTITLPTGGIVTYNYNGPNDGFLCQDAGGSGFTRQTSDGTWTYARSYVAHGSAGQYQTTITAPSGQTTTYLFTGGYNSSIGAAPEYEVSRTSAESNGTAVGTIVTCYNGATTMSSCASLYTFPSLIPTEITSFTQLPNSSGRVSETDTVLNSIGMPTQIKTYEMGICLTHQAPTDCGFDLTFVPG